MTGGSRTNYHAIVLGLGGLGSGALYWLARRLGGDVLGLDQFELGHERGGSHDHSRIIRYSYHRPAYVELAKRAYDAWREVERQSGETLIHQCGGLDLFPEGGVIGLSDYTDSLNAGGIDYELIDDAEVTRRWPQFRALDGVTGLYQKDGGLVAAARGTAAHQRLARDHGATMITGARVESVRSVGGEVEVVTTEGRFRCQRLVCAAGAWSNQVLGHMGIQLPLTVTQEQVSYFACPDPERFAPDRFPVWIWMDDPCYYGFPTFGEAAVKIARDVGGDEVTTDTRTFQPNEATLAGARGFLERYLPEAVGPLHYAKTCLYTLTPDRDFVVDRVPSHDGIVVLIGAGHAFKFASALGQVASELALDGATPSDLGLFSLQRPVLREPDPAKNFMV